MDWQDQDWNLRFKFKLLPSLIDIIKRARQVFAPHQTRKYSPPSLIQTMRVLLFLAVLSKCVLRFQGAEISATTPKTTIFKAPDSVQSNAKGVKKTSGLVPVINKYSTGSKSGKSKSKAGKSKAGKGKGYANSLAKPNKVVTVNVSNCIAGTRVQLVCSSTSTVIQTIVISSESNSKCQFAIPQAAAITHYYINVVPATTVYTCDGGCKTYLQTSITTVTMTIVKKTTKISKMTTTVTGHHSVGKAPTPVRNENTAGIMPAKPVMKITKAQFQHRYKKSARLRL